MAKNYCPVSTALLALFMRKEEISYLKFHETYVFEQDSMLKPLESLGYIKSYPKKLFQELPRVAPKLSKALAILWSNVLVGKVLDSQSRGPVFKTTAWLQGRLSLSSFRG